jgi:hypothetical protein
MKNALILLFSLVTLVLTKKLSKSHKFYKEDFYYSTKFGAPGNSNVQIQYRARLLNYVKSEDNQ